MKRSFEFETAVSGIRSNLMSYALMLTSSRAAAGRLVDETSARAYAAGVERSRDLKGVMFSIMRDLYNANYRGLQSTHAGIDAHAEAGRYTINVARSRGIASVKGVKSVDELTEGINRLQPSARRVFTMYATGYTHREIRRATGMSRLSVLSRLVAAIAAIF